MFFEKKMHLFFTFCFNLIVFKIIFHIIHELIVITSCLLYTSDAADE